MSALSPAPSHPSAHGARTVSARLLRLTGAALIVVSAVIHGALAGSYGAGAPGITLGKLFIVQSAVALLVAVWLLLRDARLAWLAGAAMMGGTLLAILIAHTGPGLPQLGPIPGLKEEGYDLPQLVTMVVEAAYLVLAAVRLVIPSRLR